MEKIIVVPLITGITGFPTVHKISSAVFHEPEIEQLNIYIGTHMPNETVVRRKLIGSAQLNYEATSFLNVMFRAQR